MTRAQRRIVLGLAGVAALVAVALAVAVATGGDGNDGDRLAVEGKVERNADDDDDTTTTTAAGATTTFALVPLTTGRPIPNAEEPPPSTQPPSATPAPAGAPPRTTTTTLPPLTGQGAVLAAAPQGTPARPIDKAKGCNSAADSGWTVKECGALRTSGTVLVWMVETRNKGLRALVLQEQPAGSNQWATVLRAADDAGTAFSAIGVRGEDVSGDGQPELAFGFHRRDPAKTLSVDLVQVATVAVHRDLAQGSARPVKGELGTWAANPDGSFERATIRYLDNAWRLAGTEKVDKAAVPPSML